MIDLVHDGQTYRKSSFSAMNDCVHLNRTGTAVLDSKTRKTLAGDMRALAAFAKRH